MLKSHPAHLDGVTLRWLDRAPARAPATAVMVVIDEADGEPGADVQGTPPYRLHDLLGKLTWRDDAVREQRTQRDAW